jgi:hypothetical protein
LLHDDSQIIDVRAKAAPYLRPLDTEKVVVVINVDIIGKFETKDNLALIA